MRLATLYDCNTNDQKQLDSVFSLRKYCCSTVTNDVTHLAAENEVHNHLYLFFCFSI